LRCLISNIAKADGAAPRRACPGMFGVGCQGPLQYEDLAAGGRPNRRGLTTIVDEERSVPWFDGPTVIGGRWRKEKETET